MQVIIPYLIKVILISAILYSYYYLALRNKHFHRYNRFYLISAIGMSVLLPFLGFSFLFRSEAAVTPSIIQTDFVSDAVVIGQYADSSYWDLQQAAIILYVGVVALLALLFLASLVRIYIIRKNSLVERFDGYDLVRTGVRGTPFSFFKNIFWERNRPSDTGQDRKMLEHELVHVKQWHSLDKLIVNIIQIIFWFNPFFWMIKRELNMIHEFLADNEAFDDADARQFSKMALQAAYPGYSWPANNAFFYSPIKRRLMMILKKRNQKVNYFGRLMVLPLAVLLTLFFTAKANAITDARTDVPESMLSSSTDTIPPKKQQLKVIIHDNPATGDSSVKWVMGRPMKDTVRPLYIIDGKMVTPVELNKIYPSGTMENIQSVSVLKGKEAVEKYGELAKDGAIEINTKTPDNASDKSVKIVMGKKIAAYPLPVYYLNGQRSSYAEVEALAPGAIGAINVWKGGLATAKFGDEGKDGVVEVTTKDKMTDDNSEDDKPAISVTEGTSPRDTVPAGVDKIFVRLDKVASFRGGDEAFNQYMTTQIEKYKDELTGRDTGAVKVRFVVLRDGSVRDVRAVNMQGSRLAEIVINAIRKAPKWNPGEQNGHTVNSYVTKTATYVK